MSLLLSNIYTTYCIFKQRWVEDKNISWANLPWVNTRPNKTYKCSRMANTVIQFTEACLAIFSAAGTFARNQEPLKELCFSTARTTVKFSCLWCLKSPCSVHTVVLFNSSGTLRRELQCWTFRIGWIHSALSSICRCVTYCLYLHSQERMGCSLRDEFWDRPTMRCRP